MAAEYGRKDKNFSSDRVYLKEFPKKKSFIEAIQSLDGGVKSQIGDIALIMMKRFFKSQISNRDQEFMTEFDPRNIE